MRFTKLASLAVIACVWCGGLTNAQELKLPSTVGESADDTYYSYTQNGEGSPSDIPRSSAGGAAAGGGCSCAAGPACDGGCGTSCDGDEPWRLFPKWCGTQLSGWVSVGATANGRNPASGYNGVNSFNDREEFQVNQVYAVMEHKADNEGCGLALGGRVDVLFGSDYIFTQAAGLETTRGAMPKWNTRPQYGLALPQVYGEVAYNDLSIKLGHFYTLIGYEVVTAPGNFFLSHAYTMQYGEPFTHTGGLGEWKYNDNLTLWGGLVNGWDKFDALTNQTSFLGGFKWTPEHEKYNFTFAMISGDEDGAGTIVGNRTMYSSVFSYNVSCNLEYVFHHDYGWQENATTPGTDAEWYSVNQYFFYTINDCWKAGMRLEWFRDDDGFRVAGIRAGNPNAGPFVGDFYELTLGLNWTPSSNLVVRPEIRWDWFQGTGLPYNDGAADDQFTAAIDMIIHW